MRTTEHRRALKRIVDRLSGRFVPNSQCPELALNVVCCEIAIGLESVAKRKWLARAQNVADDPEQTWRIARITPAGKKGYVPCAGNSLARGQRPTAYECRWTSFL